MAGDVEIKEADDLEACLAVERAAFGGEVEAELVRELLVDGSAQPVLSLLARSGGHPVGHVLFTRVRIEGGGSPVSASILAPLAVIPGAQGQGIGGLLIREGLRRLEESGVGLVFVLGYPDYYPRHGFQPAGCLGFEAPYPILEKNADAWMVRGLGDHVQIPGPASGLVRCADALDKPEYWLE